LGPLKRWETAAVVAILATAIAAPVALYQYYKHWEAGHYRALIPGDVAVGDAVFIGSQSGFREGCGTAVFALAPGAAPFDARHAAATGWTETPYVLTGDGLTLQDRWQVGLGCAGMGNELAGQIRDALNKPGSYVKRGAEDALIVMPHLNLVALVYDG
jgi:hypothetical protein